MKRSNYYLLFITVAVAYNTFQKWVDFLTLNRLLFVAISVHRTKRVRKESINDSVTTININNYQHVHTVW